MGTGVKIPEQPIHELTSSFCKRGRGRRKWSKQRNCIALTMIRNSSRDNFVAPGLPCLYRGGSQIARCAPGQKPLCNLSLRSAKYPVPPGTRKWCGAENERCRGATGPGAETARQVMPRSLPAGMCVTALWEPSHGSSGGWHLVSTFAHLLKVPPKVFVAGLAV